MRPGVVRHGNGHELPTICAEVRAGMPDGVVHGHEFLCRPHRISAREVQPV